MWAIVVLGYLRKRAASVLRKSGGPLRKPACAGGVAARKHRLGFEPLERRLVLDSTVVFNEILYNPAGAEESLEWVELHNQMAVDMDVSGWSIEDAVDFEFAQGTVIPGEGYLVVAADPDQLELETGFAGALGPFAAHLSNGGERIELVNNSGRLMDTVEYDDEAPWPVAPDGSGASLAKIGPDFPSGPAENWTTSAEFGGTPGGRNFLDPTDPTEIHLAFNEVAAAGEPQFWLELANYGDASIQLDGYVLATSAGGRYVFPARWITPGGFVSITQTELGFRAALGDKLFLYTPDLGQVVDGVTVEDSLRGRSPDGTGGWLLPDGPTPETPNRFAFHDEIVINEIMYHYRPQLAVPFAVRETTPVEIGASWRYEQSGTDLGTAWREPVYEDGPWSNDPAVFGAGTADYGGMVLADGPVSYWNFDESASGSGTAYDQVGDNHGTFQGAATRTGGLIGTGAARLSGSSTDAVNVGNGGGDFSFTTGISVEAVIRPDAGLGNLRYEEVFRKEDGNNRILFSFQEFGAILSFGLNVGGYGELDMPLDGSDGRPTLDELKDGSAHHLVATYDSAGGEKAIWVDGTRCYGTNLGSGSLIASGGGANAYIGSLSGNNEPFNGIIDEVALYDYALSPQQIAGHGAAGVVDVDTPLVLGPTTFYFRNEFPFEGDPSATELTLNTVVDDGAVFYLNGVEVYRQNMPDGSISYDTLAASEVDAPGLTGPIAIPSGTLFAGANLLAVEVHQAEASDDDVFFAAELVATESISEGLPFAESSEEWIELYNRSEAALDLSGWRIDGGIDFQFPAETTIESGGYLVVARNAEALRAEYPGIDVVGDFSRRLSDRDDRVLLVDADGNPADEVHYYEDRPWPACADGGGSSLELRDPDADNSKAEAWAASIEGAGSDWQTITYRGVAARPPGSNDPSTYHEFHLGLLQAGEVLLDDVSVIEDPDGAARQLIQNGSFQSGTADKWRILGTHHGTVVADAEDPGNRVLHLIATGPTEHLVNHAETTLKDGSTFVPIRLGEEYEISLRAKWLAGSNQLSTRLFFNLLPKTTVLEVPELSGTPGAENSAFEANVGPTYGDFRHDPVTPAPGQNVTVSVVAEDPHGVTSATLRYRLAGGAWTDVAMTPGEDGRFAGTVPGQSAGAVVQFYVEGQDGLGATSTFPAAGRDSRALLKVDDGMGGVEGLRNMRILMTPADTALLGSSTNLMSNDRLGATVVCDGDAFYDVGVRLKGSEHGRPDLSRRGFSVKFHADRLFRGVHETIGIDRSGGWRFGRRFGQDEILIYHIFNHAGDVPSMYSDLVYVEAPTVSDGTAILQLARYNDVYLASQFRDGSQGTEFEYELIYTMVLSNPGNPESLKVASEGPSVFGVPLRNLGDDPEAYRHYYLIKNNRTRDDYGRLMDMAKTFSLSGSALHERTAEVLDVDEWLRAFAAMSLIGAGDNYSTGAQHNANFYVRPEDNKMLLLPWDMDFAFVASQYAPLSSNADLNKLIGLPANRRAFHGHLYDIINTSYNTSYMAEWVAHYDALLPGQDLSSILSYIGARASYVLNLLPAEVPFEITTNGGNDFAVDDVVVTIAGNGWINVREIRLEGGRPLAVTWTDQDSWQVTVPLAPGANRLTFQAFDFQGNLVGSDGITVTSTMPDRPLQEFLRVTELNYFPADPTPAERAQGFTDENDFEFIELQNVGDQALELTDVRFTEGIDFTFTSGPQGSPVLITEASTATDDYVEIQNISGATVDTSGWVVAVNNAENEDIQQVHTTLWRLPASMAANEVLYRTDNEGDPDHYWGENIWWMTTGNGWVMLVDDVGNVADFVVWGYDASEIELLSANINGFNVTVADAWNGAAVPAEGSSHPVNSLQRRGNSDDDNASQWAFVAPPTQGIPNPGLATPFRGDIVLDPGELITVVRNVTAFEQRYGTGIRLAGHYSSKLDNQGEQIKLEDASGGTILDFEYGNSGDWPGRANGRGASLELIDAAAVPRSGPQRIAYLSDADHWRSSNEYGGSPGTAGTGPVVDVVVNEVLTHTDWPARDTIELYNTTGDEIDLGGWFLSDSWGWGADDGRDDYKKFRIPDGTKLPAHGYLVFDENDFNPTPDSPAANHFALDGAHGDDVWLMEADGTGKLRRFADHVEFGAAPGGESFGRWPNGSGDLYPMITPTLDPASGLNSSPRVGPVIISEIMYYPAIFHESFNTGDASRLTEVLGNWQIDWFLDDGRYRATPASVGQDAIATINLEETLGADYVLEAEVSPAAGVGGYASNAVVIFDYHGPTNFKFAGPFVDHGQWRIGHRNAGGWVVDAALGGLIEADTSYDLRLRVEGSTATLLVDGDETVDHDFGQSLHDGLLGIGAANSAGSFGRVAVEPPAAGDLEFIEIYNPTGQPIDLARWLDNPHAPTQYLADWRLGRGVDMEFDEGTTLAAESTLVVLSFDPDRPENASRVAAFRDFYEIDASVPLAGGYDGNLSNGGERVRLLHPDSPPEDEPDFVPHYIEDEVDYDDLPPWPTGADGNGGSLNRTGSTRWGNDAANWLVATPSPGSVSFLPSSQVAGRHVFYNNSAFDGKDPAANLADDGAIATDKEALLPGGTATFGNYTSYCRGINGIMVDIAGLPGTSTDDDFRFRVGNGNDPGDWATAPGPGGVTVRPGEGVDQSDRITIIWADNAIQKQWLQVTVLANSHTGLAEADVFYFGNAMGESGNSATDAKVNAFDMLGARDNQRTFMSPAPIDFAYDFNRDARVNTYDMLIARDNQTHFLNALRLITVPPGKAPGKDPVEAGKETVHDAVLGRSAGWEPGRPRAASAQWHWLYEFEGTSSSTRPPRGEKPAAEAVDQLLVGEPR